MTCSGLKRLKFRYTPIHLAAMNGHAEIVKVLLENTEDSTVIEAVDVRGSSALSLAGTLTKPIIFNSNINQILKLNNHYLKRFVIISLEISRSKVKVIKKSYKMFL